MVTREFWSGRHVFVTGHTGFKGSWLALWLQSLGARVYGYALAAPTQPNLFTVANVAADMAHSEIADIRDTDRLMQAMQAACPEIVFHLAAQPLVRHGYAQPVDTYEINVMGAVHLFEAVRATQSVKAVVNITTDKCYENREWVWGYRENESLGGVDPYSSSKGCAELVTSAYRQSFFASTGVALASARAGNVLGGGDWATDRLIPDSLRAADKGEILKVRSPHAIRPWQHVLEPLSGYLRLAERLYQQGDRFAEAWNFGPMDEDAQSVSWLIERMTEMRGDIRWQADEALQPHEAGCLKLDSSKARNRLQWQPRWRLHTALRKTLEWHEAWRKRADMRAVTLEQLADYEADHQLQRQAS